ncbi:MAG TPA: ferrous iron transport protein B [Spirochaetota bacterium]|nr:ferrous iron transport protein B [Spirochaetota bacterium]
MHHPTIAITGNPNCGKTTIFNALTGSNQKIGNWPGVTVEKIEGVMNYNGSEFRIVDLPGIYSLSAFSEDERVSRDYLLSREADLVINILDAANIERNLYLTTQLIELKIPMIIILNRMDMAEKQNKIIDTSILSAQLGCCVIESTAIHKNNTVMLKNRLSGLIGKVKDTSRKVEYPNEIEEIVRLWSDKLKDLSREIKADERWISLKLLEKDPLIKEMVLSRTSLTEDEINLRISNVETLLHESADILVADYRYGFIQGVVRKVVVKKSDRKEITDIIDRIVLNRIVAVPVFLATMYFVFWITLFIGGALIEFFDTVSGALFVDGTRNILVYFNAPAWLITVIANGAGAGIQAVSSFIPIIFSMFFMLAILEDSGYMARAAFVMDRIMRVIGLPGKSFVPLMIGFGCSVPAVMAARTLEEKKDRIITVFITPFMTCGARLSVYVLFTAAFFQNNSGIIVLSLYMAGIILAVLTGILMKKTIFPGEPSFFVMELPIYNLPRFKHIILHTWIRLKLFLFSAGKVIVGAVMILSFFNSLGVDGTFENQNTERSMLTNLGKSITPVFGPMGITGENWPASVAIFSGPFAKEAIVGTLNSLYTQIDESANAGVGRESIGNKIKAGFSSVPVNLKKSFRGLGDPLGIDNTEVVQQSEYNKSGMFDKMRGNFGNSFSAYAYLLFILIYFPCIATVSAVYRESGLFIASAQVIYMTLLAWIVSVLFFQLFSGHSLFWAAVSLLILSLIVLVFFITGKIIRKKSLE